MDLFSEEYLMHHGILGQKWGIRRFQNADGSLTPAGVKRYGSGSGPGSTHNSVATKIFGSNTRQNRLTANYRAKGYSKQQAEEAAAHRAQIEKTILKVAGVTLATAAVATTAAIMYNKYAKDDVFSKDLTFKRVISLDADSPMVRAGAWYGATNEKDAAKYVADWGEQQYYNNLFHPQNHQAVYQMQIRMRDNIKIPNERHVNKVFQELCSRDSDFHTRIQNVLSEAANNIDPRLQGHPQSEAIIAGANAARNGKVDKKVYDAFNICIRRDPTAMEKFYEALRQKGYNGIYDVNDKKYSGYNTKSPIIVFQGAYDYSLKKILSDDIVNAKAVVNRNNLIEAEQQQYKQLAAYVGTMAAASGGIKLFTAGRTANNAQRQQALSMHNSGKTNKEIAEELNISESMVSSIIQK